MRLTDAELRALWRRAEGKQDLACLALTFGEIRAMVAEIIERRLADDVRQQIADEDLILDEEMPDAT